MFGSIARRYDLANHFLSCGCDFIWRRRAAEIVAGWNPQTILDLATGTGDLALALAKALPNADIVGADFSEEMVAIAQAKGVRRVVTADALSLPFADRTFDCLTIAFGLRNIKDWNVALREMARVLGTNGNLLVMEFSLPSVSILRAIYRFYLHRLLPIFGSFLTRNLSPAVLSRFIPRRNVSNATVSRSALGTVTAIPDQRVTVSAHSNPDC